MKFNFISRYPRNFNPFLHTLDLPVNNITGNPDVDGLQKYDVDFLETSDWTSKCLNFVKDYQGKN